MTRNSQAFRHLSFKLLLGCVIPLALAAQASRAQIITQYPPSNPGPIKLRTTALHVTGKLEKGECRYSLTRAKLQVVEYWYVSTLAASNTDNLLQFPVGRLRETGVPPERGSLAQGRVLGELELKDPGGPFDVQWQEWVYQDRVPWRSNVLDERTGEVGFAYRVLSLNLTNPTPIRDSFVFAELVPRPHLMFFGTEATKHVGTLKVKCWVLDG